jgi:excisionase family DNA binding protein
MKDIILTELPLEDIRQMFREELSVLLTSLPTPLSHSGPSKELLTPVEASLYLKLTRSTLYNMVHKRTIPHMKKGGKLYFSKDELHEWVLSGRKLTKDALGEMAKAHLSQLNKRK